MNDVVTNKLTMSRLLPCGCTVRWTACDTAPVSFSQTPEGRNKVENHIFMVARTNLAAAVDAHQCQRSELSNPSPPSSSSSSITP